jgi:hypothetical protein
MVQRETPRWQHNKALARCMPNNQGYGHTLRMHYLLLFYGNNDFVNKPHYYVIRTLPVLLTLKQAVPSGTVAVHVDTGTDNYS